MMGLWIALGAFFGAICRYGVSRLFATFMTSSFPAATFIVNVIGSFLLGLFVGSGLEGEIALMVTTGFLGSLTTFSTFQLEGLKLWENGERKVAVIYFLLTNVTGIGVAFLGIVLGRSLGS